MICPKCQKENREGSKFCRFCGAILSGTVVSSDTKYIKIPNIKIPTINLSSFSRYYSKRLFLLVLLLFFVAGSGVFAAPKIKDYLVVNKILENVEGLERASNYVAAVSMLDSTEGFWMLGSQKQEIEQLKKEESDYLNYQKLFNDAQKKEEESNLEEARNILKSIDPDFPQYALVEAKLNEIQNTIEENLKKEIQLKEAEAKRAAAAEAEAKRQAQAEAEAKTRAQVEAQREADARVQAEAEQRAAEARARAEAEARARAQVQAEAEARRRQQEEWNAFVDEVVTINNSIVNGINYTDQAVPYLRAYDNVSALSANLAAATLFGDAEKRSQNLLQYRTPSGYQYIGDNLKCAASNLSTMVVYFSKAIASMSNWDLDSADYYINQGGIYESRGKSCRNYVSTFLTQQGR